MKIVLSHLVLFFFASFSGAQSSNVFLSRDYWKANPSIEVIQNSIEMGNSISELDQYDFDAVAWGILENVDFETLVYMIEKKGNDVNKITHDGRTYVFWAAYKDNLELMHYLIDHGAKTDLIDAHGYSLLNFCAVTGQMNTKVYDLCIEKGCKVKEQLNNDGANPLLLIIPFVKERSFLEYFIDKGLSLESKDETGNNAFVYAAKSGNKIMMDLFIEKGLDPRCNEDAALFFAAKGMRKKPNHLAVFEYLKGLGLSLNASNLEGSNLLHVLASKSVDTALLQFLLVEGVGLNKINNEGNVPLSIAVARNNKVALSIFEKNKADFKIALGNETTLMHLAVKHEDRDLIRMLLKHQVPLNVKNTDGMTPLHLAAMSGTNIDFISSLIEAGADKTSTTIFGENAYDLAKENELLKAGKQINILKP